MTKNWNAAKALIAWMLVALLTMGAVIASPMLLRSDAATVKETGTVIAKDTKTGKWGAIKNGKIDTSVYDVAKNQYGWWRVEGGYVTFKANGIYKNAYGWWKTTNSKVTFNETGIFKNDYGWWRVVNSKVDFSANGIYKNDYGWWKTTNGKVTFNENGVFSNEYGTWYVVNSKVDFSYNGETTYNGKTYTVTNGKATLKQNAVTHPTAREKEAIETAKELVAEDYYSRAELVEELKDAGYTQAEAEYAADNCGVNYAEECKDLLEALTAAYEEDNEVFELGVSQKLAKDILKEFEYTDAEIEYAIKNAQVDWNHQAVVAANIFIEMMEEDDLEVTKDILIEYLTDEEMGFTQAQAEYAASQVLK